MPRSDLQQSDLTPFDDAVAGHDGVFSNLTGSLIIKPCTAAEIAFYETSLADHPDFAMYMPTFIGTLRLGAPEADGTGVIVGPEAPVSAVEATLPKSVVAESREVPLVARTTALVDTTSSRGKKLDTGLAVVLENVAASFKKPNVMDVKLGSRLWADDASPEKRAKLESAAKETTSSSLGFRVAGMRVWNGLEYRVYDKTYGRTLRADSVVDAFEAFLYPLEYSGDPQYRLREQVLHRFRGEVKDVQQMLEKHESRIYSASLLFVYEGDSESLEKALASEESAACHVNPDSDQQDERSDSDVDPDDDDKDFELPRSHALKIIDFAHASWTPGLGPDENMIQGVRGIAKILEGLKPP